MKKTIACLLSVSLLTACTHPSQNRYGYQDVGQATVVEFGTVVSEHVVDITGQNTGLGAGIGAAGGAIGGAAIGRGAGSLGAMLAGAVIAGVAGAATEQALADRTGIEYVITMEEGETITLVQNYSQGDPSIKVGQRVMVQTSGMYQRVLPADGLPEKIKRPKSIKVTD